MIMEVGTRIIDGTRKLSEHLKASVLACFLGWRCGVLGSRSCVERASAISMYSHRPEGCLRGIPAKWFWVERLSTGTCQLKGPGEQPIFT